MVFQLTAYLRLGTVHLMSREVKGIIEVPRLGRRVS
jgi:hypothetical protein